MTIGLFEASETTMALLKKFPPHKKKTQTKQNHLLFVDQTIKNIKYVKDEGSNLYPCAPILNFVVSCENFGVLEPFSWVLPWKCLIQGLLICYSTNMLLHKKNSLGD